MSEEDLDLMRRRNKGIPWGRNRMSKVREVGISVVYLGSRKATYMIAVKVSLIDHRNMVYGTP